MLNISIYQINMDRDENNLAFMGLDWLQGRKGMNGPDCSAYDKVFGGPVEASDLEDVYLIFNRKHPAGYLGRSLSVSDVVEVIDGTDSRFYFCDHIGFKAVEFDPSRTKSILEENMEQPVIAPEPEAKVYRCSMSLRQEIYSGSYDDCLTFCEDCGWEFKDENDFVWDLDLEDLREQDRTDPEKESSLEAKIRDAQSRAAQQQTADRDQRQTEPEL